MIKIFIKPILDFISSFIKTHPYIGYIVALILLIWVVIHYLGDFIPRCQIIKARVIMPIARKYRFKRLVKKVIKNDIQGNVNLVVRKIKNELPTGWIQEVDIEWVERENKDDFFNDNEIVIRMRPLENQKQNFVLATYYFFKKAFFPKTKRVIPEVVREASVLHMCKRLIKDRKNNLIKIFEEEILEQAVTREDKILNYLDIFNKIDMRGFFASTFLREIHEIADKVKFNKMRKKMDQEIVEILKHIVGFLRYFDSEGIPQKEWHRFGPVTSYSFLLIAHPKKTSGSIQPYLKRAEEKLQRGVCRLYVFGAAKETKFAEAVINSINKYIPKWRLLERFDLYHDYRGDKGGIGALFVSEPNLSKRTS